MHKLIATLSTLAVLAGGVVTGLVGIAESAAPTTAAVVCAQPFDPTVRYVVNTVCSKFGP